jgi:hypothetical protein
MAAVELPHRKVRVRVTWNGEAWIVNLPHYIMVPGTWEPVAKRLIHPNGVDPAASLDKVLALEPTVEVLVPERLVDPATGKASKQRVRDVYRGQPLWDHDQVTDDL